MSRANEQNGLDREVSGAGFLCFLSPLSHDIYIQTNIRLKNLRFSLDEAVMHLL